LDEHHENNPNFLMANLPYLEVREAVPSLISKVMQAADRIGHIVSELRSFARAQGSSQLLPVDVNQAVRSSLALLEGRIKKATSNFSIDLARELPLVNADQRGIGQVVLNLLLNACEALPDQSKELQVRTFFDAARSVVVIEVRDQGVGIAAQDLPFIRDPFFTKRREGGATGLGLAVASRIVEDHGGRLEFESKENRGTVARLELPRIHRATRSTPPSSPTTGPSTPRSSS
jgi:polar amino acid transport system substrate-binding protein